MVGLAACKTLVIWAVVSERWVDMAVEIGGMLFWGVGEELAGWLYVCGGGGVTY